MRGRVLNCPVADSDAAIGEIRAISAFSELGVPAPMLKNGVIYAWRVTRECVGDLLPFGIMPLCDGHRWRLKGGQDNVVSRGQLHPEVRGAATLCSGITSFLNHNFRPKGVVQVALSFEVHHLGHETHLKRGDRILLNLVVGKDCAMVPSEVLCLPLTPHPLWSLSTIISRSLQHKVPTEVPLQAAQDIEDLPIFHGLVLFFGNKTLSKAHALS